MTDNITERGLGDVQAQADRQLLPANIEAAVSATIAKARNSESRRETGNKGVILANRQGDGHLIVYPQRGDNERGIILNDGREEDHFLQSLNRNFGNAEGEITHGIVEGILDGSVVNRRRLGEFIDNVYPRLTRAVRNPVGSHWKYNGLVYQWGINDDMVLELHLQAGKTPKAGITEQWVIKNRETRPVETNLVDAALGRGTKH